MRCKSQIKILTTAIKIIQNVLKDQQDLLGLKSFQIIFDFSIFLTPASIRTNFQKADSDKQSILQSHKTSN